MTQCPPAGALGLLSVFTVHSFRKAKPQEVTQDWAGLPKPPAPRMEPGKGLQERGLGVRPAAPCQCQGRDALAIPGPSNPSTGAYLRLKFIFLILMLKRGRGG